MTTNAFFRRLFLSRECGPTTLRTNASANPSSSELMVVHRFGHRLPRLMFDEPFFIVIFRYVDDVHPSVAHLVDRTLPPADPLVRVGFVCFAGSRVVPRCNADASF